MRLRLRRIFFPTSRLTQEREKLSTDKLPPRGVQDSPLSFFCPTSCSSQESEGFFYRQATYKVKYGKAKEAIGPARASLSPQEGDMRKSRKETGLSSQKGDVRRSRKRKEKKKTKEGEKVAPAKARFRVPYTKNSFFLIHEYLGLEAARLGWSIGSYETRSTRKPCAKEVPETDYFTQRKQYLERTTLRRLKIPLRSICSKEGPHYRLGAWARKLSSDKRQSTFIHELDILWWFHTWAVLRSLANTRKCQLEDFCEKERYESCSVQRTFTADAFRRRRKRENLPVVLLLQGSHKRLAFKKPLRSVPETWGRMYDVLALRN